MSDIVLKLSPLMRAYIERQAAERGYTDIAAFAQILVEEAIQRQRALQAENKTPLAR